MYPEDRVLVTYVPSPDDFNSVLRERWYRIPLTTAPKGLYAEYFAFYFGQAFAENKYAIHYFARRSGHELLRRRDLLPAQAGHPRADEMYYKVQLEALQRLARPIVSLRWRRILFLHTTWDRFMAANEIGDLLLHGDAFVDRVFATLRERDHHFEVK